MNRGFLLTIPKLNANRCIGKFLVLNDKKSTNVKIEIQGNDDCFFFYIKGIVHIDWVPEGQTMNQHYYISVLANLREWVRRKRNDLWRKKSWILHQDNAPAQSALSVKTFLAKRNIPILDHPPYSPDLAPSDFFLFPKVKSALKGTRFETFKAVKEKATEVMNGLPENDLQHCYEQWKIRMERCRDRGGEYIEGDNMKF